MFSRRQLLVRGGAALALVAVLTAGLLIKSTGVLDRYVNVIADLHNVGDGLPPRSDVKYRGVLVGAVDEVTPSAGTQPNRVRVRLKPMYARSIPATVTARVVPSNVFAVSALQLVDHGPGAPIREGGHIAEDTRLPTVLFQTTVNKLRQILTAAGRGREDNTVGILAAVGAATNHRRAELLTSAAQLDRMLDQLNAIVATDQGPSTVSALVQAAHGLSQTAPDLVDALHQAVRPMQTLAEKREQLRTFIGAGVQTTGTTVRSLHNHTDQLIQITTDLTPVLGVLADNAQHFVPITRRITRFSDTFFREVWDPELATAKGRVNLSFTPSYTYTRADCPRYGELKGPSCLPPRRSRCARTFRKYCCHRTINHRPIWRRRREPCSATTAISSRWVHRWSTRTLTCVTRTRRCRRGSLPHCRCRAAPTPARSSPHRHRSAATSARSAAGRNAVNWGKSWGSRPHRQTNWCWAPSPGAPS